MRDARIRLFAVIALSIAAFLSITGAIAAFAWWLVFTPGIRTIRNSYYAIFFLLFAVSVSLLVWFSGGNGLSYMIRMSVILLIAFYVYSERSPGEFLDLSVWLFGRRMGFDIGLAAEMSIQSMEILADELHRIRIAFRLKGIKFGLHSIIPASGLLIHSQFLRAEEQADLLAVRGYRGGGMVCPKFDRQRGDVLAGFFAIFALILAFIPVRDIFILLN